MGGECEVDDGGSVEWSAKVYRMCYVDVIECGSKMNMCGLSKNL